MGKYTALGQSFVCQTCLFSCSDANHESVEPAMLEVSQAHLGLWESVHTRSSLLGAALSRIQLLLACSKLLISNVTAVFHNCTEAERKAYIKA